MSVHAKKHLTENIEIVIGGGRRFVVPKETAKGILYLIKSYEVGPEESVPWRESSKALIGRYSEAGVVLRGLRAKFGLSQEQLADQLGIPQSNISEMENGKRSIGKGMAKRLAGALSVDYRVFL